jgi:hypothetical protein
MNIIPYFTDGSLFRYKEQHIVYNKKGITYLDKALDDIPIECCIYDEFSSSATLMAKEKNELVSRNDLISSKQNLERITVSYKSINKKNFSLRESDNKCVNNKQNYKFYKNYDLDNICDFCGDFYNELCCLENFYEVGHENEDYYDEDYYDEDYYDEDYYNNYWNYYDSRRREYWNNQYDLQERIREELMIDYEADYDALNGYDI